MHERDTASGHPRDFTLQEEVAGTIPDEKAQGRIARDRVVRTAREIQIAIRNSDRCVVVWVGSGNLYGADVDTDRGQDATRAGGPGVCSPRNIECPRGAERIPE